MENQELTQWLLGAKTPTVRYLTLRHLLGRPEMDADVQAACESMGTSGPIPAILARQTREGRWANEKHYYGPKYISTHWSMLLLAELGNDPSDPRQQRGAAFMLADTQNELEKRLTSCAHGLTCFWANLLRYSLHSGMQDDPRILPIVQALVSDALREEWRCEHNDEKPCVWGAARGLWGLAALPPHLHSTEVQAAIQSGLTFLLETYHLVKADYPHPEKGRIHTLWSNLNFPLFYQADILFVLRALSELGALDHPGATPALEWLVARRGANGRWRGANPYQQRTWKALGGSEEASRWVSLHATWILNQI